MVDLILPFHSITSQRLVAYTNNPSVRARNAGTMTCCAGIEKVPFAASLFFTFFEDEDEPFPVARVGSGPGRSSEKRPVSELKWCLKRSF